MDTSYDIYNTATGNLIGSFWTEQEALEEVYLTIKEQGIEAVSTWALWPTDLSGRMLADAELIARAMPGAVAG